MNIAQKKAHTNNRQFPTKPFQINGGCTAQMAPTTANTTPHTHQDLSSKACFAKIEGEKCVAPTQAKATKHNVKNAFSKPIWGRQL